MAINAAPKAKSSRRAAWVSRTRERLGAPVERLPAVGGPSTCSGGGSSRASLRHSSSPLRRGHGVDRRSSAQLLQHRRRRVGRAPLNDDHRCAGVQRGLGRGVERRRRLSVGGEHDDHRGAVLDRRSPGSSRPAGGTGTTRSNPSAGSGGSTTFCDELSRLRCGGSGRLRASSTLRSGRSGNRVAEQLGAVGQVHPLDELGTGELQRHEAVRHRTVAGGPASPCRGSGRRARRTRAHPQSARVVARCTPPAPGWRSSAGASLTTARRGSGTPPLPRQRPYRPHFSCRS